MEINNNLIHVTECKIKGVKAAVQETKRRSQELDKLNKEVEKKIDDISSTYHVTEKYASSTKTSYKSYIIGNPNRDIQKQFYEGIIKEKVARIQAINDEQNAKQAVENQLQQDLWEYQAKYKSVRDSMVEYEKTFREQMSQIQQQIDSLTEQLNNLHLVEAEVATRIGLQGENVLKYLELVTTLKTDIHEGANIYQPLKSAIIAVRAMVQGHIMLLQSSDPIDIFAAGTNLRMKVAWLNEYHTVSCEHLATSIEYDDIRKRHPMNTIEAPIKMNESFE